MAWLSFLVSASATCTLFIPGDELAEKYDMAAVDELYAKGYAVTNEASSYLRGALTLVTGRNCETYLLYFRSCVTTVQIGRQVGNAIVLSHPVTGADLTDAIHQLPRCE